MAFLVFRFSRENLLTQELLITSFNRLEAGNWNHSPSLPNLLDRFYAQNTVVLTSGKYICLSRFLKPTLFSDWVYFSLEPNPSI